MFLPDFFYNLVAYNTKLEHNLVVLLTTMFTFISFLIVVVIMPIAMLIVNSYIRMVFMGMGFIIFLIPVGKVIADALYEYLNKRY